MKKLLSIVLSLVMVMTMLPTFAITASAAAIIKRGEKSKVISELYIGSETITDCTEYMEGEGWRFENGAVYLQGYVGSGISFTTINGNDASVIVLTDSYIYTNTDFYGIYSTSGLRINADGATLNIYSSYIGIYCTGLLSIDAGRINISTWSNLPAYAAISQNHYAIEEFSLGDTARVNINWETSSDKDVYGLLGVGLIYGGKTEKISGKISVNVKNTGSGNAYAHDISESRFDILKSRASIVYQPSSTKLFVNCKQYDNLLITVNLPIDGGTPSYDFQCLNEDINTTFAAWMINGTYQMNPERDKFTSGNSYTAVFMCELPSYGEFSKDAIFSINGKTASVDKLSDTVYRVYYEWKDTCTDPVISTLNLNGTIRTGNVLNDNGPLTFASTKGLIDTTFVYSKDGKVLSSSTKATYGNYDCTVTLFADDEHKFTKDTVLNYAGKSYKAKSLLDNNTIISFEIPNIYVECPHTSASWGYDTTNHWQICSTCKAKINEGTHNYRESISGSTITFTCTECGFKKEGKVAETRTAIYRPYIDFGTAMVGDAIPTTVKLDYANMSSGSEKYYNYATVQSVKYSTTGTFKNAKTTVTVVLKANEDYYFESIARPTAASSCFAQYTNESKTVSEDGTTLTAVFSFTPYTTADVTLTLPAEFSAGKTYAEIAKEVQFKVNGVAAKDYSVLIKKAGESSWTISNISNGVVSEQYMYESVIEPNTEYEFGVNSNVNRTYAKSLTITNKNVAVITDSYYGEYGCRVNATYTSAEGHNYDGGTITKQATCTEAGSITFKCTDTDCKSTKTMVIPAKGHQASTAYEIPATCVDEGKTAGEVCSRCDTVLSGRKPIAPTGEHYYSVQLAPEVKPTCNADGKTAIVKCGNCNAVTGGEVIKSTGKHNYSTSWSKDATNHWHACSCGAKKDTAAHTFTTTVTKATTTADGKKVTKCSVCGYTKSTVIIKKVSTVKLSSSKYTYSGSAKSPTLTVMDSGGKALVKGTDYTVSIPSGRKNVGRYTYKITFKGNYSGTKSLSFSIVPKSTTISSLTAASKGFTVKWKKQATQTTGYQIQIATDSGFTKNTKSYTVTSNSTVSKKITGLTGGKKYYVRIRTYKTVSGTKYYSAWSGSKTVTTKK